MGYLAVRVDAFGTEVGHGAPKPALRVGMRAFRRIALRRDDQEARAALFRSFALGASIIVFFYNIIHSWKYGPPAPGNPWRAMTLEWQVTSPPPIFNFDEIPQVIGGPYEYGVAGARHAVFNGDRAPAGAEVPVH